MNKNEPRGTNLVRFTCAIVTLVSSLTAVLPERAHAQTAGGASEVFAGGQFESYLRYLQTVGKSAPMPWSIRGFSPSEIDALSPKDENHPWAGRYAFGRDSTKGFRLDFVRPTIGFTANTSYPWGSNDGPVWAGKGLTSWAQVGAAVRWAVFSARLAPIAFRSENTEFELMPNGQVGDLGFAHGQFPFEIDVPQRFGSQPYTRIDLGESEARVDVVGITAGASTSSQWWGPTTVFPYILGNNAGGYPHVFFGTARPLNIGFGHAHGRVVYGRLTQSKYSSVRGNDYFQSYLSPGKVRFMAGLVGTLQIRGIPGFEVGGARFFHAATDSNGIKASDLRLPLQNFLKNRLRNEGDTVFGDDRSLQQNQLASVFFRWAPPGSGAEVYGEYGREDFSADKRDFLLQPDHSATLNVGFRKAWLKGQRMNAVRAEVFTYEAPAGTRTRGEGLIYLHQPLAQGHTYRGQMLGANVGPGSGSAQQLAVERFTPAGRLTGFVSRVSMGERTTRTADYYTGPPFPKPTDIQYSLGLEATRFVGPFDITGRAAVVSELNRYFASDKNNLNLALIVRQGF
ncbi:MAG TPA: capsule assembly Wzi family protein [Gemmatimonadaceae bacterium]|nr:capsule assembly Wzi family protein [Gemmatimonadaceae bacterium]